MDNVKIIVKKQTFAQKVIEETNGIKYLYKKEQIPQIIDMVKYKYNYSVEDMNDEELLNYCTRAIDLLFN